jgi:hypothetical protein
LHATGEIQDSSTLIACFRSRERLDK